MQTSMQKQMHANMHVHTQNRAWERARARGRIDTWLNLSRTESLSHFLLTIWISCFIANLNNSPFNGTCVQHTKPHACVLVCTLACVLACMLACMASCMAPCCMKLVCNSHEPCMHAHTAYIETQRCVKSNTDATCMKCMQLESNIYRKTASSAVAFWPPQIGNCARKTHESFVVVRKNTCPNLESSTMTESKSLRLG